MKETITAECRHALQKKYRKGYFSKEEAVAKHRAYSLAYYYAHREQKLAYQREYQKHETWKRINKANHKRRYREDDAYRTRKIAKSNAYNRLKRARRILPPIISALMAWNERRQV